MEDISDTWREDCTKYYGNGYPGDTGLSEWLLGDQGWTLAEVWSFRYWKIIRLWPIYGTDNLFFRRTDRQAGRQTDRQQNPRNRQKCQWAVMQHWCINAHVNTFLYKCMCACSHLKTYTCTHTHTHTQTHSWWHIMMTSVISSLHTGRFCGSGKLPGTIISSESRLWIEYRSSPTTEPKKGFVSKYEGQS